MASHVTHQIHPPSNLDPSQFAYRAKRSTEDAIYSALHPALTHLDKKDSYVRMLFIDFSSAFNTITPQQLICKLDKLGLSTSLCNWLLDFLTQRPQAVRVGNNSVGSPRLCARTAVNSQTGVCTPAGGIITSLIVLLSLAFLMPAFYYIPKASLAAVIICAVAPLLDYRTVVQMWRIHRLDLLPFSVTFLMSFWQVQWGILGGVAMSGALLLYDTARPKIQVSDGGVLLMEPNSGLSFPATDFLSRLIHTRALQASRPRSAVLDCRHVSVIDYTVVHELRDLLRQFRLRGVQLVFCRLQPHVLDVLLAADLQGFRYTNDMDTAQRMTSDDLL
ncbi:sodium-independent sulfate anion transporter-like [Thalassophryne amazonica]|uniref:sodium-independent sulfate anion transporter-like n=1 Tax=Thalassophryne amazonica TaxID=390379 RepID=UPI001470C49D|nr:sodium-independent sulfate anion transporter-like [Thalassophryne amazonica]